MCTGHEACKGKDGDVLVPAQSSCSAELLWAIRTHSPGSPKLCSLPPPSEAITTRSLADPQYYKRDTRRAYPQTSVVTQTELSALLIAGPAQAALPSGTTSTELTESNTPDLTVAIAAVPNNAAYVAAGINTGKLSGLPPTPPAFMPTGKWQPRDGEHIPRFEHQYFPIKNYI